MEVFNETDYDVMPAITLDARGGEALILAVKGTWDFGDDGAMTPSEEPIPLTVADEFAGEPGLSSVTLACDLGLPRPATDVLLLGSARPRRRAKSVVVSLTCGPIRKQVRVTGRRRWGSLLGLFPRLSGAQPFESLPLLWENAFGGTDEKAKAWHDENPVGRGFRGPRSRLQWTGTDAPNLEHPGKPVKKPGGKGVAAGFGYVASHWLPRRPLAGTYDARWEKERAPLLPDDFDPRFLQVAPADQIVPGRLKGGEPIEVENAGPAGSLRGEVPRDHPIAFVTFDDDEEGLPLKIDEVAIHADLGKLTVLWKGSLPVVRRVDRLSFVDVQMAGARREAEA